MWPGPAPGLPRGRPSSATDREWRSGMRPEAGGAPSESKVPRGTKSPAVTLSLCGRGSAVRGRTWSRRRRRADLPASPALHLTMGRPCAADLQARSPASGPPKHRAADDSSNPAPGAPHTAGKPSPRWPRTRTAAALRRRCCLARRQGSPARRQRGCPGGAGRRPRRAIIYSAGGSPGLGSVVTRHACRGFHAQPVQGAASALREGQKRVVAVSGDNPKAARAESRALSLFIALKSVRPRSTCGSVYQCLVLRYVKEATEPGSVPVWRYGQASATLVGSGRSRAIPADHWNPGDCLFRERAAPVLGALPAPRKLHIEVAAGAAPLTISRRHLAPPRRRRRGE